MSVTRDRTDRARLPSETRHPSSAKIGPGEKDRSGGIRCGRAVGRKLQVAEINN